MANKLVVGNLKAYMRKEDVVAYLELLGRAKTSSFVVCPSTIYIPYFIGHHFKVGIQDISSFGIGANTGDVAALQAHELGVSYALIGHSERRRNHHEDLPEIQAKIKEALASSLVPIVCIGETLAEYEQGTTIAVLKEEITFLLQGLTSDERAQIIIAYEPVWAIGTGKAATETYIDKIAREIKKMVVEHFSSQVCVLYGGSVNEENIHALEKIQSIDGYLIGKSATTEAFLKILEVVC